MKLKGIVLAALLAVALAPAAAMAYDYDGWSADYDLWEADYDTEALDDYYDEPDYDTLEYDEDIDADAYYDEYAESDDEDWTWDEGDGEDYEALEYDEDWDAGYEEDPEYSDNADSLNEYDGTYWYGDRLETWYSSEDAYHYQTDEWWVDDEGFYRTDDGYYVIAASDYEYGDVVEGSKGLCMVLDDGADDGVSDYYVAW